MAERTPDTRLLRAVPLICGEDYPGQGFVYDRPQGVEDFSMVLTLKGEADVGTARQKWTQRAGDVMLIEPGHAIHQEAHTRAGWLRLWVIFAPRPHWHEWFNWPELAPGHPGDSGHPGYRQLHLPEADTGHRVRVHLAAMCRYAGGTWRRRHEFAMNALEAALLECDAFNSQNQQMNLDPRVVAAVEFIGSNLHRRLMLDTIAEAVRLSVPHLNRLFRRQLDLSPMNYVERQRMQRATELLSMSPQPIAAVAAKVGFHDPLYFSNRFKRYTGMSPRAYRRTGRLTMA